MLSDSAAFGSFSTDSVAGAERFYGETLGLDVVSWGEGAMGAMLTINHPGGGRTFIYEKEDHAPASHTVLNFTVSDVAAVAAQLEAAGVELERLPWTDDDGIARGTDARIPATAWFKDPAGNWICIVEEGPGPQS